MTTSYLAVALFVALMHGALAGGGDPADWGRIVGDGDSYLRLLRVTRWLETGLWYDNLIPGANAPFGLVMHWTRPFDVLLAVLAAPFLPFLGLSQSVHAAGVLVSPLLHVLTAVALVWALAPSMGRVGAALAGGLSALQVGLAKLGGFGIADHHFLFLLLTVLALGFALRTLVRPSSGAGEAVAAGLTFALGLWAGPEMLVFLALVLVVLGLVWVAGDPAGAGRLRALSLALLGGLALALLLDRGWTGFGLVEQDRISAIHLVFALLVSVAWAVLSGLERRAPWLAHPSRRLAVAAVAAVAVAGAMAAIFPQLLLGPKAAFDPETFLIFETVEEYAAIDDMGNFLAYLGAGLIGLPVAYLRLREEWGRPAFRAWCLLAAALAVYMVLAQSFARWAVYAEIFACPFLAEALLRLDRWLEARPARLWRLPAKLAGGFGLAVGPLLLGGLLVPEAAKGVSCPTARLVELLGEEKAGPGPHTVLAAANDGPEILYRTDHSVVATLHHRNKEGMRDSLRILRAEDEGEAGAELRRRGIDLIALCPGSRGNHFARPGDKGRPDLFYRRLEDGRGPEWARELPLPSALPFRLFRVVSD
ncbi:MAG: hypothetical protein H7841_09145 [Magnetospirillum sp. WYHS-4]